uniref:Uncharacterized protein n=1 Tax=viral metagenome TaxID=1070528 RepID=A0A6C0BL95_9ZZZZ
MVYYVLIQLVQAFKLIDICYILRAIMVISWIIVGDG